MQGRDCRFGHFLLGPWDMTWCAKMGMVFAGLCPFPLVLRLAALAGMPVGKMVSEACTRGEQCIHCPLLFLLLVTSTIPSPPLDSVHYYSYHRIKRAVSTAFVLSFTHTQVVWTVTAMTGNPVRRSPQASAAKRVSALSRGHLEEVRPGKNMRASSSAPMSSTFSR